MPNAFCFIMTCLIVYCVRNVLERIDGVLECFILLYFVIFAYIYFYNIKVIRQFECHTTPQYI